MTLSTQTATHPTGLTTVNESVFESEVLRAATPVLVDFYADWCGPCQTQTPILESLAANQGNRVKVVKVDVDKNPGLAQQFGVRSIPTLVLFQQGNAVATGTGVHSEAQLNALLNQAS